MKEMEDELADNEVSKISGSTPTPTPGDTTDKKVPTIGGFKLYGANKMKPTLARKRRTIGQDQKKEIGGIDSLINDIDNIFTDEDDEKTPNGNFDGGAENRPGSSGSTRLDAYMMQQHQ